MKNNEKPMAVIDSETDPFRVGRVPAPFIWGYYDGENYKEFFTTKELIKFLYPKDILVYAHNGGRFDYHFMTEYMHEYDDIMVINGRLSQFKIGLCEFRDSVNILPISLDQYAKEKIDYAIMEKEQREKPENVKTISDYLKSDCVNLYNLVTEFERNYGRNMTLAGTAMKIWQKQTGIMLKESIPDYYDIFSPYYYGGRVQCFKRGVIDYPFELVDINSAYPFAMLERHPISLSYKWEHGDTSIKNIGPLFFTVECVARGCFPYREKTGLIFPNDNERRRYTVTGWELQAARDTGTISGEKVIGHYWHSDYIDFTEYVKHFYALRLQAKTNNDKAKDIFAKLLLNGLYGKFGSNPKKYKKFELWPQSELVNLKNNYNDDEAFQFGGLIGPWLLAERALTEEEQRYYNVATAASVTGFVRAYLWRAICECDNVLYCDTDSIAAENVSALQFGNRLGEWEQVGTMRKAYIGGKKLYAFQDIRGDWKTASKGVTLTPQQIKMVAQGGDVVATKDVPTFSIRKEPAFVTRRITATGGD